MSKEGRDTPRTAKSATKSVEGISPRKSKEKAETQGSKDIIQEQSNGKDDKLCLPSDYSQRREIEENAPLLASSTVGSNPAVPVSISTGAVESQQGQVDKEPGKGPGKRGCACYSSKIEDYRIPSIAIVISLTIETCAYLALSGVLLSKTKMTYDWAATSIGCAGVVTLPILILELIRYIPTYCQKEIKTAVDWKWPLGSRVFLLILHVIRLLFLLTALIFSIMWPDFDHSEITIAFVAIFLIISGLHIFTLAWPKKI